MSTQEPEIVLPEGATYNWARGCSIGCAVLLLAGIVAAVAVYRISVQNISTKRDALTREVQEHFLRLQTAGKISAEHAPLLDSAMREAKRPEVGFFGLLLYGGGILAPFEDGSLTPEELALVEETRSYLLGTPAPSPMDYGDYVSFRPLLQQEIAKFEAASSEQLKDAGQP